MLTPPEDNVSLLVGNVDVFCETCWRVWQTVLAESYDDLKDFDERNSLDMSMVQCAGTIERRVPQTSRSSPKGAIET
jgi:hypothetical protein